MAGTFDVASICHQPPRERVVEVSLQTKIRLYRLQASSLNGTLAVASLFPVPGADVTLDILQTGQVIGDWTATSLYLHLQRQATADRGSRPLSTRIPGGVWSVKSGVLHFFVEADDDLFSRSPKLTWQILNDVIRGTSELLIDRFGARAVGLDFNVDVDRSGAGLVLVAFGGLEDLDDEE